MKTTLETLLKSFLVPILLVPATIWAADCLWHVLRYQASDTTQGRVVGLLLFAACVSFFYAFKFYTETLPVRRDERLRARHRHDAMTDISLHRKDGTRACTKCLYATPSKAYPLHDNFGHGRWECSGCKQTYKDERLITAEREHFAQQAEKQRLDEEQRAKSPCGRSAFT